MYFSLISCDYSSVFPFYLSSRSDDLPEIQTTKHSIVYALLPGKIPGSVNSPVGTMKIGVQISDRAFKRYFLVKEAVFRKIGLYLHVYKKRHFPSLGGRCFLLP